MKTLTPPKAFRVYIDRLLEYLVPRMHLNDYKFNWKYVDRLGGEKGLTPVILTEEGYSADVGIDPVYLTVDIRFSIKAYKKWKNTEESRKIFAQDLIHEIAHAYHLEVQEATEHAFKKDKAMLNRLRNLSEQNTERIARCIFESVPKKYWK